MKTEQQSSTHSGIRTALSLEERLIQEEKRFAESALRRTALLAEITDRRRRSRKPGADPNLEKTLWKAWEEALARGNFGPHRHWRGFLAQANSLAYSLADQDAHAQKSTWSLYPAATSHPVRLHGPSSLGLSTIFTFWSAVGNSQITLLQPALNDSLIELIKALNQTGAGLSWDNETITHRKRKTLALELEHKTIHLGEHRTTLALMLALALGRPGVFKFSGSGALNMHSLKPWQKQFAQLGARLHQLNPHAPGLPVRLESSGLVREIHLSPETPEILAWALLAAAPFYPEGLRLTWPEDYIPGPELNTVIQLLQSCAVPVTRLEHGVHVPPSPPEIQEQPELPLDPGLCALLLAWSRFSGHPITVVGSWPEDAPDARRFTEILASSGLKISADHRSVTATPGKWPSEPVFDVRNLPEALPLAVILGLGAPRESFLACTADLHKLEVVAGLLRQTGRACEGDGLRYRFRPAEHARDSSRVGLEAPDAMWGMAIAMLSFVHPGLTLNNPGELTTLWPRFWHVFQTVLSKSKPKTEPSPTETADVQPETKRRRVRI